MQQRRLTSFGGPTTHANLAELSAATGGMVRRVDGQAMPAFNPSTGTYVNMGTQTPFSGVVDGVGTIQNGVRVGGVPEPQQNIQQIALPKNPALADAQTQMLSTLGKNLGDTLKSFRDYRTEADKVNAEAAQQLAIDSKALDVNDFKNELADARTRWETKLNEQRDQALKYGAGNIERFMASTGLPTLNSEVLRRNEAAFYNSSLPTLAAIAAREAQDATTVKNMELANAGRLNAMRQNYLAGLVNPIQVGNNILTGANQNLANLVNQDQANTYHSLATNYEGGIPGTATGNTGGGLPSFNINPATTAPTSQATNAWNLGNTMDNSGAMLAGRTGGRVVNNGALPSFVNPNIQRAAQRIMQQRPGVSWNEAVNEASRMMPQSGVVA